MSSKFKQGYCKKCKEDVLMQYNGINHILHLILSIVTAGFWIIPWIIIFMWGQKAYCPKCSSFIERV